jgi:hypothetical protein
MDNKKQMTLSEGMYYLLNLLIMISLAYFFFAPNGVNLLIEVARSLEPINHEVANLIRFICFTSMLGAAVLALFISESLDFLLPKTELQLKLKKELKRIDETYPRKIALIKRREARKLNKIEEIKSEIKKLKGGKR